QLYEQSRILAKREKHYYSLDRPRIRRYPPLCNTWNFRCISGDTGHVYAFSHLKYIPDRAMAMAETFVCGADYYPFCFYHCLAVYRYWQYVGPKGHSVTGKSRLDKTGDRRRESICRRYIGKTRSPARATRSKCCLFRSIVDGGAGRRGKYISGNHGHVLYFIFSVRKLSRIRKRDTILFSL